MEPDEFDLAGAVVGVVEAEAVVDGSSVRPGHVVIGLISPNLRSNGFSLIRSAVLTKVDLDEQLSDGTVAEVLLAPSVLYSPAVQRLLAATPVAAMAHITGGGMAANIARVLPATVDAVIEATSWPRPAVFGDVAEIGEIAEAEMFTTFNMGIGYVAVVDPANVGAAMTSLAMPAAVIGEITPGDGSVMLAGVS
jgi:phosphoribosylformylglycinamidine cyclo-ligase